ncbi:hypothetical protein BJX76DRAFT_30075 [Aspergillus varians]
MDVVILSQPGQSRPSSGTMSARRMIGDHGSMAWSFKTDTSRTVASSRVETQRPTADSQPPALQQAVLHSIPHNDRITQCPIAGSQQHLLIKAFKHLPNKTDRWWTPSRQKKTELRMRSTPFSPFSPSRLWPF